MFKLTFTESSLGDLHHFKKSEQTLIVDAIEKNLLYEPLTETRNRKKLRLNELSDWELRVEKYRIFYDVNLKGKSVKIKAIGWKEHNRLFIQGREFTL